MTIFSALITSGILILMAIASLVIFERGLTRNSYERFLNNGNSCVAYLETQSVLSHKWILEAKQEYGVELRILNNGKRLFFDKLNEESSSNASGENGRKSSVENYAGGGCQNLQGGARAGCRVYGKHFPSQRSLF